MLINITLSAEETLIEQARRRAEVEHTTLNAEFRRWLAQYAERPLNEAELTALISRLSYAEPGRTFTRDERNER